MSDPDKVEAVAERMAELDPEVRKFLAGLTPDRVKYLEASIQFSRDRETAGRFLKWIGIVFAFVTGAIVALEKVGGYVGAYLGGRP